jgi:hypothetical protein
MPGGFRGRCSPGSCMCAPLALVSRSTSANRSDSPGGGVARQLPRRCARAADHHRHFFATAFSASTAPCAVLVRCLRREAGDKLDLKPEDRVQDLARIVLGPLDPNDQSTWGSGAGPNGTAEARRSVAASGSPGFACGAEARPGPGSQQRPVDAGSWGWAVGHQWLVAPCPVQSSGSGPRTWTARNLNISSRPRRPSPRPER